MTLLDREVEVEHQAQLVELGIRVGAGIVLVLIIGIELDVLSQGKKTARVYRGVAPFGELTLIEEFGADVRCGMVRANRQNAF